MDPALALESRDIVFNGGVEQPIQSGHGRAIFEVRFILNHDGTTIESAYHDRTASREGSAEGRLDHGDVIVGRVEKGAHRQNCSVWDSRAQKPCEVLDADECEPFGK